MADPVLELKARVALLAAPARCLAEGALTRALGRVAKTARAQLLADLESAGIVALEPGRRGRRVRLLEPGAVGLGELRVSPRARFSGAVVNAILACLPRSEMGGGAAPRPSSVRDLREQILAAHARLSRGPGGTVDLAALREALPTVDRRELEVALIALDRAGEVALGRPVDLGALDARARSAAIEDPTRGLLVYVSRTPPARAAVESRP